MDCEYYSCVSSSNTNDELTNSTFRTHITQTHPNHCSQIDILSRSDKSFGACDNDKPIDCRWAEYEATGQAENLEVNPRNTRSNQLRNFSCLSGTGAKHTRTHCVIISNVYSTALNSVRKRFRTQVVPPKKNRSSQRVRRPRVQFNDLHG